MQSFSLLRTRGILSGRLFAARSGAGAATGCRAFRAPAPLSLAPRRVPLGGSNPGSGRGSTAPRPPQAAVEDPTAPLGDELAYAEEGDKVNAEVNLQEVVLDLPPPTFVKVKTASYISSSVRLEDCPQPRLPEFAVIGRSNVGKSSLINLMTSMKGLAMVSKQPGKTKCINHFLINDSWYMVDLPGYGYAKTGKSIKVSWSKFTKTYFLERETLVNVLLLVDASIPPQGADLECANWLGDAQVPFSIVFTKTDKKKKKCPKPEDNIAAFKRELSKEWEYLPKCIETSSSTGRGREDLLRYIASLRELFNMPRK